MVTARLHHPSLSASEALDFDLGTEVLQAKLSSRVHDWSTTSWHLHQLKNEFKR